MEERLARLESMLQRTMAIMEELSKKVDYRIDETEQWKSRVERTLYGNNGHPGLLVKLDRLEQSQEKSRWVIRALITGLIGLVVAMYVG